MKQASMHERFPGLSAPIQDMQAVRDRRRTGVLYFDVALDTARSLAAGTALVLNVAGSILYIDQRANTGYATVHLVDETFNAGNTPITVFSGYILRAPFTQLVIENEAQPGQTLRILYGIDIDFVPGSGAGVTVTNAVNVADLIAPDCRTDTINLPTAVALNQVTQLLAPAANPSGILIRHMYSLFAAGAGGTLYSWTVAAASAPAAIGTFANMLLLMQSTSNVATFAEKFIPLANRRIPAGWGIWNVTNVTVAIAGVHSLYWSYEVS